MNRTQFLKSLLARGLLITVPFLKSKEDKLERVLIYQEYIAGFQFAEGMKVKDKMKVGDELLLVREPENAHDENAVAVYWNRYKIGYVPMADNIMPNDFIQKGLALRASIDKLNQDAKAWKFCKAGIYLLYPKNLIQKKKPH